ncbi:hypothetical protein L0F63_004216 [Massospora cicadina]|nr:hypothetical protein L0F63_004216 [Massospora cicadina]
MLSRPRADADGNTVLRRAARRPKDTPRTPVVRALQFFGPSSTWLPPKFYPKLQLERVLGFTATRNAGLSIHPTKDIIVYPAGPLSIGFSSILRLRASQPLHLTVHTGQRGSGGQFPVGSGIPTPKAIVSTALSPDGRYLAVGEAGRFPRVLVWDLEIWGAGVGLLPDLKHLASLGYQHDGVLNIWNWRGAVRVASNRVTCKVFALAFASDGSFCVTVGHRHFKFWTFEASEPTSPRAVLSTKVLDGRSGALGNFKMKEFLDVVCSGVDRSVYAVTSDGHLCMFNECRQVVKSVDLKAKSAICLAYDGGKLVCGCSDGTARVFLASTLKYLCTLPNPHPLGADVSKASHVLAGEAPQYPDTVAVRTNARYVVTMYSDHSFYIWDWADPKLIKKVHSAFYHREAVWESDFADLDQHLATCSNDGTLRFWDLDESAQDMGHGRELTKVVHVEKQVAFQYHQPATPATETAAEALGAAQATTLTQGVRCLKFTDDGRYLVTGDRQGNLRVYSTDDFQLVTYQEAHDAEILAVDVLNLGDLGYIIASASRDRLIHVYSLTESRFRLIQTIDDHSSSITAVCFFDRGQRLISCGADKSLIFRARVERVGLPYYAHYFKYCGRATLYALAPDYANHLVTVVAQDKRLHQFCAQTGKLINTVKSESLGIGVGMTRIALDASGQFACVAGSDKAVRVVDLGTNTLLGAFWGHSEMVTSVRFLSGCSRIVSTSGDGCIFVWRVRPSLATQMRNRLLKLTRPTPVLDPPRATTHRFTNSRRRDCSDESVIRSFPSHSSPISQAGTCEIFGSDSDSLLGDSTSAFTVDSSTKASWEYFDEDNSYGRSQVGSSLPQSEPSASFITSPGSPSELVDGTLDCEAKLLESPLKMPLQQYSLELPEISKLRRSFTTKFKAFTIIPKRSQESATEFPRKSSSLNSPVTSNAGGVHGLRKTHTLQDLQRTPSIPRPTMASKGISRPLSTSFALTFPNFSLSPKGNSQPPAQSLSGGGSGSPLSQGCPLKALAATPTEQKLAQLKQKLHLAQQLILDLCQAYAELGPDQIEVGDQLQVGLAELYHQLSRLLLAPLNPHSSQVSLECGSPDFVQQLLQRYSDMLICTVAERLGESGPD